MPLVRRFWSQTPNFLLLRIAARRHHRRGGRRQDRRRAAATSQLDATAHHIIYVATPTFGARGLYLTIVHALGAKPRAQKAHLIAQTQTLLAAEEHERRRRVVEAVEAPFAARPKRA